MADTVAHRGPDDAGVWADERAGLALGHRRLAIRDLSPTGHQPMVSSCGRYVIVYNGEIYSQDAIVRDLGARVRTLRGHSDTEVILEACAEWGVEATVHRLIGMFAFALVDRLTGRLILARDRLGIKPLYWARSGSSLAFELDLGEQPSLNFVEEPPQFLVHRWNAESGLTSHAVFVETFGGPFPLS